MYICSTDPLKCRAIATKDLRRAITLKSRTCRMPVLHSIEGAQDVGTCPAVE